jgi:hypothetical protein
MKTRLIHRSKNKGFALIVTLSLMILLTIIAVGLLTLSSVSIRNSSQGGQVAAARANARLAMMIAIGELQKSLGPDQAITATSGILNKEPKKAGLMGVWDSWDFDLTKSNDYKTRKSDRFKGWLVSAQNPEDAEDVDFGDTAWDDNSITMAGEKSFGGELPKSGPIVAGRVPVNENGKSKGAFAWYVSDESVKARANLYRDPGLNKTVAQKRALLAGHRPDLSVIESDKGKKLDFLPNDYNDSSYKKANEASKKVASFNQLDLSLGSEASVDASPFRNDVSPYSMGVLADVRNGGLKQDLSSIFELSNSSTNIQLPKFYAKADNRRLYSSTHGITGQSDPKWTQLASCYNIFKDIKNPDVTPKLDLAPEPFDIDESSNFLPDTPNKFTPMPVVAKAQILMTYLNTQNHSLPVAPAAQIQGYQAFICYAPIVTLHNPYNVELSFDILEVDIKSIPIGIKANHPGMANSPDHTPFNQLYNDTFGSKPKAVVLKISNWKDFDKTATESTGANVNLGNELADPDNLRKKSDEENRKEAHQPIIMKPGETLICSPYLNPDAVIDTTVPAIEGVGTNGNGIGRIRDHVDHEFTGGQYRTTIVDFQNQLSASIKGIPGYKGPTIGIFTNHVKQSSQTSWTPAFQVAGSSMDISCKGVRPRVLVNGVQKEQEAVFEIENRIIMKRDDAPIIMNNIRIEYGAEVQLDNLFQEVQVSIPTLESFIPGPTPPGPGGPSSIGQMQNARPFALFTAAARTTSGGVNEVDQRATSSSVGSALLNGRYAGKPYLFHNASIPGLSADLQTSAPASLTYELSLEPVDRNSVNTIFQQNDTNNSRFITGNTAGQGLANGVVFDVPTGPMQAIADFRKTNVLASGFLPHLAQPIANSLVPPLMATDSAIQKNIIPYYPYLDHSVLANHALYDRFYFSTFARNEGNSPSKSFEGFMSGEIPLISQSFEPYLPKGKNAEDAKEELFSSSKPNDEAYRKASQYQMVKGPFNVNSTNVEAWKAKLASLKNAEIPTLENGQSKTASAGKDTVPLPGLTLGTSGGINLKGPAFSDDDRENRWNGFRQLKEKELENLAENIVEQVRNRGPFLSMSEFVNRRISSGGPEAVRGALEVALDKSEINEETFSTQIPIKMQDLATPAYRDFKTPEAMLGNPAAGAPGWVTQGDIMKLLEPAVTVRSDTFVIRVYGEAGTGDELTRVYAEAVVQRFPDFIDSEDDPSTALAELKSKTNKTFGRRLEVVSFRWLNQNEI